MEKFKIGIVSSICWLLPFWLIFNFLNYLNLKGFADFTYENWYANLSISILALLYLISISINLLRKKWLEALGALVAGIALSAVMIFLGIYISCAHGVCF